VTNFVPRSTLRPLRSYLWPGGSGTHAALVAEMLGQETLLVGFSGGHTGARLREVLAEHHLHADLIQIADETRETFSLLDIGDGNVCDVAEAGPAVSADEVGRLAALAHQRLVQTRLLLLAGSLPPGCPRSFYTDLLHAARERGIPVLADLAGEPLRDAVQRGVWMVKPSLDELREIVGPVSDAEALALACAWHQRGVENVCISLGARGVWWVSPSGAYRLTVPAGPAYNTIGCGDAMVGAVAARFLQSGSVREAMRAGVAAATANLTYDAPGYCTRADLERLLPSVSLVPA
jgi:1-phosphofructokinase family hexose kinase